MSDIDIRAAEILEAAACVIRLPGWWTQGGFARNDQRHLRCYTEPEAVCFCAVGAIYAAADDAHYSTSDTAIDALSDQVGNLNVGFYNDAPGRTAEEVSDAMLRAAEKLRRQS